MNKQKNVVLQIGTFLINIIFFSMIITTGLFFLNIAITKINIILAILCSMLVCYFQGDKNGKTTLITTVCSVLILLVSIVVCIHSFDYTWDGNTYHKTMTGFLMNGWNPLKMTFYDYADAKFPTCTMLTATWYDAYPKGSETFAACIYAITGNIESGKCFNFLASIGAGLISYSFLYEAISLKKIQASVCAFFFVINPVVISQLLTYYIDGFLWQIFLLNMCCLLYLTLYKKESWTSYCYYMLIVSIVIGLNLKFSSLIYFGIPCMIFFMYWFLKAWKEQKLLDNKIVLFKRFFVLALGVVLGTCFVGATSYIINIIRHKNPLYTMIGEGSQDLITVQLPPVFQEMNYALRFVCSLFSKVSNSKALEKVDWKIPFSVHPGEYISAQSFDVRTAGWGIIFSGIFILSLVVIIVALFRNRKKYKEISHVLYLIFAIVLCAIVLIPGLSWARYFAALFYIPVIAIVYMMLRYNRDRKKICGFMTAVLVILLCINMIPNMTFIHKTVTTDYESIVKELEELREATEDNNVVIGYNSRGRFSGRFFTLSDMKITNYTFGDVEESQSTQVLFPSYGLVYEIEE